jgi:hypothetical protein
MTNYYVPQYMPPPQPAAPARNGFGTTALVLGIIGALFAFIPIIGVIAWPMVILGLIFGVLGIQRARKGQATNQGIAIAGTALSALGLFICVIWTAAFGASVATTSTRPLPAATVDVPSLPSLPAYTPPAVPAPVEVKVEPGTIPGNGTFVVGKDIEPGTYKTAGPDGFGCYYARLKDTSGDLNAIINNNVSQGPATVTIKGSDGAFETSGCHTWSKTN